MKLISRITNIQSEGRKCYSPNKLCTQENKNSSVEYSKLIKTRKKYKLYFTNKKQEEIAQNNARLDKSLKEIAPRISTSKIVNEYISRKKLVQDLRANNIASLTAVHLLTDLKSRVKPLTVSQRLAPSRSYTTLERPKSAGHLSRTASSKSPYNTPAFPTAIRTTQDIPSAYTFTLDRPTSARLRLSKALEHSEWLLQRSNSDGMCVK